MTTTPPRSVCPGRLVRTLNTVTQNSINLGPGTQTFVGANARNARTVALVHSANGFLVDDPGPMAFLRSKET